MNHPRKRRQRRDKPIQVRLYRDEYAVIRELALADSRSMADMVRLLAVESAYRRAAPKPETEAA